MTTESTKTSLNNLEKKISKMSFESSMVRLEQIVETLSSQRINLDLMIDLYQEGSLLRQHCNKKLEEAQMKIETVSVFKKEKIEN